MKKSAKFLSFLFITATGATLAACGGSKDPTKDPTPEPTPSSTPTPSVTPQPTGKTPIDNDSELPSEIPLLHAPAVQIHYQKFEGSYKPWCLWLWAEGKNGSEYYFNYQDDYGVVAYYPLSDFGNSATLGFIVKEKFEYAGDGVWNKDGEKDRFMDTTLTKIDENQVYHVYLASGSSNAFSDKERTQFTDAVTKVEFTSSTKINVVGNNPIKQIIIRKNGEKVEGTDKTKSSGKDHTITLAEAADVSDIFTADITFEDDMSCVRGISIRKLYDKAFDEKYAYDGELGAIYSKESTTFKVWSPVSQDILVNIYDSGTPTSINPINGSDEHLSWHMEKDEHGVFSAMVPYDLAGKYYTYSVFNAFNPEGKEIVDPYARSAGVNGLRGMVVDVSEVNPEGWDDVHYLEYDRKELAVYETHIAELTCSDTWTGDPANAKLYAGFHEAGTTYKGVTTGFDHIKELGVNAVQIIPIFDQANDELNMEFNWGYNPLNYNVLEGGYSSDPTNGFVRIQEFKELVRDYNEAGISIIMDVVYNHVNGLTGCNFDVLMPYYYFRYEEGTGSPSNGSGCGNETASDKPMFRKFMIDSVCFWTKEYKLGGFRFDLMGIHDIETMNLLTEAVKEINPNIVIYGEPWAGGTTALPAGFTAAVQANAAQFKGYGQFNDIFRDAMVKSGMNRVGNKGWVMQDKYAVQANDIVLGMTGQTLKSGSVGPDKTMTYATCHDNYTLHDRFVVADIKGEETFEKMNVLANSMVFTSQGTCFMLAGEEMLRTKIVYDVDGNPVEAKDEDGNPLGRPEVSGNSYSSCYKTNEINYQWKVDHPEMFETYKKLIDLKKNAAGLHEVEPNKVEALNNGNVIKAEFASSNDVTNFVVYHANGANDGTFAIDTTGYSLYLDTLGRTLVDDMTIQPYETIIMCK